MTDHVAEAWRILAGTSTPSNSETGRGAHHQEPSLMELRTATVHALLAIADAIRDAARPEQPISDHCGAIRQHWPEQSQAHFGSATDWPCVLNHSHNGPHTDRDGDQW